MSIEEENKASVLRVYELYSRGEYDSMYALWAPGAVIHASTHDVTAEQAKQLDKSGVFPNAFSDFRATIENIIAEGDMVAYRVKVTGTHTGEFMGIPPTGKKIIFNNAYFTRMAHGKMVEAWGAFEFDLLEKQLREAASQK